MKTLVSLSSLRAIVSGMVAVSLLSIAPVARGATLNTGTNDEDETYVSNTSHGLVSEVLLGKLAQTHSATTSVRSFGTLMVRDHSRDYVNLGAIVAATDLTFFTVPDSMQRDEYEKLSKLYGSAFDREYISFEIQDHIMDIHDYLTEYKDGENTHLRLYANSHLFELYHHLQLARAIAHIVGAPEP